MMRIGWMLLVLLLVAPASQAGDPPLVYQGRAQPLSAWVEAYERCLARQAYVPPRGEYESRAEYEARLARLHTGCADEEVLDGVEVEFPVFLEYDPDEERFSFQFPDADGFHVDYRPLVRDDFPQRLGKLLEDQWHVDAPTPRAVVYKECQPRNLRIDTAWFESAEPYRAGPWRGCSTAYERGEEYGWERDRSEFRVVDLTLYAYSPIPRARALRDREAQLYYRIRGRLTVDDRVLHAGQAAIVNRASGEVLLQIGD